MYSRPCSVEIFPRQTGFASGQKRGSDWSRTRTWAPELPGLSANSWKRDIADAQTEMLSPSRECAVAAESSNCRSMLAEMLSNAWMIVCHYQNRTQVWICTGMLSLAEDGLWLRLPFRGTPSLRTETNALGQPSSTGDCRPSLSLHISPISVAVYEGVLRIGGSLFCALFIMN